MGLSLVQVGIESSLYVRTAISYHYFKFFASVTWIVHTMNFLLLDINFGNLEVK